MLKKVKFSENISVHEIGNTQDEKSARKGMQWIQAACDRQRFQMRIQRIDLSLNDVLVKKLEKINEKTK